MSELQEWRDHRPQIGVIASGSMRDVEITGCRDCAWRSTDESHGGAGFAHHLEQMGAPDYMLEYFRFWANIVEVPFGELNRDQVARELFDYSQLMENASRVYDDLAGLSKPNTDPAYIIQGAERRYREAHAYELAERAYYLERDGQETAAQELREIAEEWHEGVVDQFADDMHRRVEYMAQVTGMETNTP